MRHCHHSPQRGEKTILGQLYLPGEASHTHQLIHIPETDQCVSAACGKVLPHGIKLDADAVGRMGVDGLDGFQLWVAVEVKGEGRDQ